MHQQKRQSGEVFGRASFLYQGINSRPCLESLNFLITRRRVSASKTVLPLTNAHYAGTEASVRKMAFTPVTQRLVDAFGFCLPVPIVTIAFLQLRDLGSLQFVKAGPIIPSWNPCWHRKRCRTHVRVRR